MVLGHPRSLDPGGVPMRMLIVREVPQIQTNISKDLRFSCVTECAIASVAQTTFRLALQSSRVSRFPAMEHFAKDFLACGCTQPQPHRDAAP